MAVRNLVSWFEIPITDMARAKTFYETVFDVQLSFLPISQDMAAFPMDMHAPGASGMLEKGEHCVPSATGILIYFSVEDIDAMLTRIEAHGGKTMVPKTDIGQFGFFAHVLDTEGNRIGLHTPPAVG